MTVVTNSYFNVRVSCLRIQFSPTCPLDPDQNAKKKKKKMIVSVQLFCCLLWFENMRCVTWGRKNPTWHGCSCSVNMDRLSIITCFVCTTKKTCRSRSKCPFCRSAPLSLSCLLSSVLPVWDFCWTSCFPAASSLTVAGLTAWTQMFLRDNSQRARF